MSSETLSTPSHQKNMEEIHDDMNIQQRTVWMWKSNVESDEWTRYSDIENYIFESAYQENKNKVELDDYCIDFTHKVQIMKDSNRQIPITRMTVKTDEYVRSESERFILQEPRLTERSFSLHSYTGGMSKFLYASDYARNHRNISDDELNDFVEKAATGIEEEGTKLGKKQQAQLLAAALREQNGKGKKSIGECCIRLYTMESFLYKLLNRVMREAEVKDDNGRFSFILKRDENYGRTLGPYCSLLDIHVHLGLNHPPKDIVVFRSAQLENEMIDDYKNNVGKIIKWESFSSTTKNKNVALHYNGNCLFRINIHHRSVYPSLEISSLSEYPCEEEVLLSPNIDLTINRVEYCEEIKKHIIHLTTDYY